MSPKASNEDGAHFALSVLHYHSQAPGPGVGETDQVVCSARILSPMAAAQNPKPVLLQSADYEFPSLC
jgi:hypothetical protein